MTREELRNYILNTNILVPVNDYCKYIFGIKNKDHILDILYICVDNMMICEHISKNKEGDIITLNKLNKKSDKISEFHIYRYEEEKEIKEHIKRIIIEYKNFEINRKKEEIEKDFI